MKCKLFPLYIPLGGMSQLLSKLKSRGFVIVFFQTKAFSTKEMNSFQPVFHWTYWLHSQREAAAAAVSPGWSASRLRLGAPLQPLCVFSVSVRCNCIYVYVCPCVGPQAVVRQITGAVVCLPGCLSLPTDLCSLKKVKERKRRQGGALNGRREFTTESCSEHIPQSAQNMSAGKMLA